MVVKMLRLAVAFHQCTAETVREIRDEFVEALASSMGGCRSKA